MADILKLATVLGACGDIARVDGALRRLQVSRLTLQLSRSTDINKIVAALQSHDNPAVRTLSKIVTSTWSTQLAEELQRKALMSKTGPKPKGTGAAGCAACKGAHRAHTCVKT